MVAVFDLGEEPASIPAAATRATTIPSGRSGPDTAVALGAASEGVLEARDFDRTAPTDPPVRLDRLAARGMPPGRVLSSTTRLDAPFLGGARLEPSASPMASNSGMVLTAATPTDGTDGV
jgi:hypothetical protein